MSDNTWDALQANKKSARIYLDVMKAIAGSNNRRELEDKLKINYPSQVKTAQRYAAEFLESIQHFSFKNYLKKNKFLNNQSVRTLLFVVDFF